MKNFQSARATFEELTAADPNNAEDRRRLALAYQKIGGLDESLSKNKDALRNYQKASVVNEALMRADPNNA
jgi:tetratricopeptide (TPR) repeat protein